MVMCTDSKIDDIMVILFSYEWNFLCLLCWERYVFDSSHKLRTDGLYIAAWKDCHISIHNASILRYCAYLEIKYIWYMYFHSVEDSRLIHTICHYEYKFMYGYKLWNVTKTHIPTIMFHLHEMKTLYP